MARYCGPGLVAVLALVACVSGCTAQPSWRTAAVPAPLATETLPVRATPAAAVPADPGPRLWPFKRLFQTDYVDARAVAERFGFTSEWVARDRIMALVDGNRRVRLKLEDNARDILVDGVRVFLGSPVVFFQGSLYIGKIDVIKTLEPLLDPAAMVGRPRVPRVIVIDPGHGGRDDGTSNRRLGLLEKTLTLDTGLRLERLLEARGYRVIMTRTSDRYVPLEDRAAIANRDHADLFVSIHFNASVDAPAVRGTEVYAMTPQFQPSTQPERDKSMIPTRYPGNRHDPWNIVFGYQMQRAVVSGLGTYDRGLKRARFVVLRLVDCPAVLVESAYLSNEAEGRRVANPAFRQRIAEAIARGIDDYARLLASLRAGRRDSR